MLLQLGGRRGRGNNNNRVVGRPNKRGLDSGRVAWREGVNMIWFLGEDCVLSRTTVSHKSRVHDRGVCVSFPQPLFYLSTFFCVSTIHALVPFPSIHGSTSVIHAD